jgi:protein-S-isoprenylcysteine O-methyltransferase Ste14
MVVAGWAALVYRIRAEERILSLHGHWAVYAAKVRFRVVPGVW